MKKTLTLLLLALSLSLVACDKPKEEPPAADPATEEPKPEEKPTEEPPAEEPAALAKVELSEAGAKLDPAVKPEQLPEGAWYCDMGTVHWAATNKPEDGKCPECGMALKQYHAATEAEQKAKAIEAKKDEHGHDHDEEGGHAHDDEHGHAH